MIVLVNDRLVDLTRLCVDLRDEGFPPCFVFLQLAEYAHHFGLAISTADLDRMVAEAFR